ncbi:MAG: hypothetical protein MJK10_20550 [Pseudomonadales bacterium]|nr:hypothetical protein [Pseudomonadales bacterium]NRA18323.1 hypothetical protein [Oceanospirillaceae bacterium]
MLSYDIYDFLGNIGVLLVLVVYLALQMEKLSARSFIYSIANIVGAILIMLSLYFKFNLSAFVMEFAWFLISVYGLYRAWQRAPAKV